MNDKSQFTLDLSKGEPHLSPRTEPEQPKKPTMMWFFVGSAGQIGFAIVIPLLLGIGAGIWIDSRFHTKPTGVLGGLTIGLILSIINLVRTVQEIINHSK